MEFHLLKKEIFLKKILFLNLIPNIVSGKHKNTLQETDFSKGHLK